MNNLIDTHFHLDYYKDHRHIFKYLNENHIYTLCVTSSPGIYRSCVNLYNGSKYVKFALGFHPLENKLTDYDFKDFINSMGYAKYIGEVGLDFSGVAGIEPEKQLKYFEKIVELCSRQNKLLSIHIRKAEKEAYDIICKYEPSKCIVHWYTGDSKLLKKLNDLNCYFSFNSTMMLHKNFKDFLSIVPEERILIESDGPFSKINGRKYRPEYLNEVYQLLSEYCSKTKDEIRTMIYNNFKCILSK